HGFPGAPRAWEGWGHIGPRHYAHGDRGPRRLSRRGSERGGWGHIGPRHYAHGDRGPRRRSRRGSERGGFGPYRPPTLRTRGPGRATAEPARCRRWGGWGP